MKIKSVKIPVKLTRKDSSVELTLDDSKKEVVGVEDLGASTQDIVKISKELSDHNEQQKNIIKQTLFADQAEADSFVIFKYLDQ